MANMKPVFLLVAGLSAVLSYSVDVRDVFNSCVQCPETDPDKINVHLIHHSHDDVGWLKTVDEYYYGLRKDIANIAVENILNSVVRALWDHPERRFIQVETAFFYKWWTHESDEMKDKFKTLVERGQLEIINGGWSMNDEGCVNYLSVIDQFTWGFRMLNETLGECGNPTFGWQIDPFGHSREHAALLWRLGFDGVVFSRLDGNDRHMREMYGNFDFLWQTSANDENSLIYGGITPEATYYPPGGFCFDILCGDDNMVDDPTEETYNVISKADDFANRIKDFTHFFKTRHIIVPMGGDFQYQAAEINFENSDKLIKAFENNPEIKLHYSTPSCYLKSVYEAEPELQLKTDDFFPYGSADNSYWAGYFTSRQNYKRLERITLNTLQIAKQLNSLASSQEKAVNLESIHYIREAIGVAQHHDSVTGTAKQHVSDDYTKILSKAINQAESNFTTLIGELLDIDLAESTQLASCLLANVSICSTTQSAEAFVVVVYNPLSWAVNQAVRLPVEEDSYMVHESTGEIASDVLQPISDFAYVKLDNVKPAKFELVFVASEVPPLGIKAFHVMKGGMKKVNADPKVSSNTLKFGNEIVGFEIDEETNLLKSVTMNKLTVAVTQQFLHYTASNGTDDTDASGAYIFRPEGVAIPFDNPTIVTKTQGNVVDEVQQRINDWITQIIRVYKDGSNYIEFDWLVGPLDISDDNGIEIISRFTVEDFKNNRTFYTDSNGREMIERRLDYRPTYTYNTTFEPIASNYYPVTAKISIRDEEQNLQVSVLNERSQAGSSLGEGQLELMIHRRLLKDDRKGVGEALNETEFEEGLRARGQHYLVLGPISGETSDGKSVTAQERILAQRKLLQPWIGVGDAGMLSDADTEQLLSINYSALTSSLPENVNVLTLEPWTDSSYILRLEHIMEKNDDPELSSSVTIDLENLFSTLKVSDVVETTLGANRNLETLKSRYDWNYKAPYRTHKLSLNGTSVTLAPMDIKTFIVKLSKI